MYIHYIILYIYILRYACYFCQAGTCSFEPGKPRLFLQGAWFSSQERACYQKVLLLQIWMMQPDHLAANSWCLSHYLKSLNLICFFRWGILGF